MKYIKATPDHSQSSDGVNKQTNGGRGDDDGDEKDCNNQDNSPSSLRDTDDDDAKDDNKNAKDVNNDGSTEITRRTKRRTRKKAASEEGPERRFVELLCPEVGIKLRDRVKELTEPGKGVLDISDDDLALAGLETSEDPKIMEENKQRHLNLYLSAGKQLCFYVSGLLVTPDMLNFRSGKARRYVLAFDHMAIRFGVKVDKGQQPLAGTYDEPVTEGLDGLDETCAGLRELGVVFAYWSCLFKLSRTTPSIQAIMANCNTVALFANTCQKAGLVPIASIELDAGHDHDLLMIRLAFEEVLAFLMKAMTDHHVYIEGLIIRFKALVAAPVRNRLMGVAGATVPPWAQSAGQSPAQSDGQSEGQCAGPRGDQMVSEPVLNPKLVRAARRAGCTLKAMRRSLPPALGGVMLANDKTLESSTTVLDRLHKSTGGQPFPLSFCYSRVIQEGVLSAWNGREENLETACNLLVKRAKICSLSAMGQFSDPNGCVFITNVSSV
ncbi:fructose-bisphosphate aldolase [Aplysia californica]|uniref:fructose-bisphosphate aldolase n=1 Tax=Aplysia californica TaxID=6500 RepID=A0ABM1A0W7_APLCA|nr:fructose-bisphosphate aldolase [Aplysia californica]